MSNELGLPQGWDRVILALPSGALQAIIVAIRAELEDRAATVKKG